LYRQGILKYGKVQRPTGRRADCPTVPAITSTTPSSSSSSLSPPSPSPLLLPFMMMAVVMRTLLLP
jgi:hypothetical protein